MLNITTRQGAKPLHDYLRAHARSTPAKAAFIWYGAPLSYGELDRMSDAFAACLAALGVTRGDRVALFLHNCPQYIIAHFGIQKLGAIVCPCSPMFKEHELAYQLGDTGAKVIVAAEMLYPVLAVARKDSAIEHVFLTAYADLLPVQPSCDVPPEIQVPKARVDGTRDFLESLSGLAGAAPAVALSMDDVALMTYTSGTTGMPKGAMLTYENALFKAAAAADCNQVDADEMMLAIAPLYHIAGMLIGINATVYAGATAVLMFRFDPRAVLQAIAHHKVTWWYSMAPMNVAVMQVPDAGQFDLRSLRVNLVTSFGITLTAALADQWRTFTGGCIACELAYGLSETHTCDTWMPRDAIKWGTHGKLSPGVECRIIDSDSNVEKAVGEAGEIVVRSPGNFKGYWNKPEATAATLRDGWVHTGDIGTLDADGYLTFSGRFKEMIKVSGYSVFPEEVETILIKHPSVQQAAVIGIPDPTRGEVVKAVIVRRPGAEHAISGDDIIAWSKDHMSPYKVPREVEFRDALPATGAGKVLRRLLKEA